MGTLTIQANHETCKPSHILFFRGGEGHALFKNRKELAGQEDAALSMQSSGGQKAVSTLRPGARLH